ncbi:hypothetical protein GW17_00056468 [Ensete ventricosum]|nr:hypothetical protein GW17_00056468 [Ensete ventricosum]
MGLITHNRIYVCISACPCSVIVDLVIIGSVESSSYLLGNLSEGDGPCDRCHCPYWRQPWPWAVAPCGLAVGVARFRLAASSVPLAGWPLAVAPCRRRAICGRACKRLPPPMQGCLGCSRSPLCRGPWPQSATPLQVVRPWPATLVGGLVVANHPYIWPNCGRLPPFLDVFAAKIQKERVERLYAIQSHYT